MDLVQMLFAGQMLHAAAYTCQVLTQDNETLQESLGIDCKVEGLVCNCSTSFVNGVTWMMVTKDINSTMNLTAKPGEWYITDASHQCVAGFGESSQPTVQKCPPGFFCLGGLEPPRSCSSGDHCPVGTGLEDRQCPFGYFCPIPAAPSQPCPDGGYCPVGTTSPTACESGKYCRGGEVGECPAGYYCPYGTKEPRKCKLLYACPRGSKSQDVWPVSVAMILATASAAFFGAKYYEQIVQRGVWVCAICALCVGVMWILDEAIACFLSLTLLSVAGNWAILRIDMCMGSSTPMVAQVLQGGTAAVALALLWWVNPPWSAFMGGLMLCCFIGWLMSRQNVAAVVVGRILLLIAFAAFIFGYSQVDLSFTIAFSILLGVLVFGLLFSWALEQRRQQQRVALPFFTRWRNIRSDGQDLLFSEQTDDVVMPQGSSDWPQALQASLALEVGGPELPIHTSEGSSSSTGPAVLPERQISGGHRPGVSFSLEDVSFDLPDGKRLLKDNSFKIAAGRRVAVMGPSGSGKTTLLAVLSGRASYGRVCGQMKVGGRPADDLRFLRHVTGFVPQDDVLHGELTVAENLRFQASLRLPAGHTSEEVDSCVSWVAKDLNLSSLLQDRVGTPERRGVSGGQRKRVSIGMELVAQPLLLFADEPTSGLDSTTSHEVVRCLNSAAASLGSTVVAVIHQPRYETLRLFDDLILLAYGGCLVFAGPTEAAVEHFRTRLHVIFPQDTNPADVLLDAIQPPNSSPEVCAGAWKSCTSLQEKGHEERPVPTSVFRRQRQPFFRAVLIFMDRSILQRIRSYVALIISLSLCFGAVFLLCFIMKYDKLDQFMMQSALAGLFLMLLQGVAAQQVLGADLLITLREARVGMPMMAYFVAKDLAALIEVTLASSMFTAAYGYASGCQIPLHSIFTGSWAFIYSVFGLNYIFSILLSPGAAQMSAVVTSLLSFCTAGVYQPQLNDMAAQFDGRGWMVPALSPIRWFWGYLLTQEVPYLTELSYMGAQNNLRWKGYDPHYLHECSGSLAGNIRDASVKTLRQAWLEDRGWVCSTAPLLLLGVLFRFLAGVCLLLYVSAQTSGWARFFGQSEMGIWKLVGNLMALLVGSFMMLFFFAEVWIFGSLQLHFHFSISGIA
eukprot:TRINITY_DN23686_c0_g1_i1.p1 TRINITY_DN23686_c0_g1~~TRINITY_DN23686_c0_g1_i1.p1  ORF type:complete len:1139 (+),score=184.49 TRINITY_DN23686_c0_g1_i1:38-3418(+)